ncbi:HTH_Tnp_Tc3_2 domain-containing protein [Trichonephila clavipes]|nr:HTH_Tnp_Tc3_2 domain-containing protein [Trichonephila clavipes]
MAVAANLKSRNSKRSGSRKQTVLKTSKDQGVQGYLMNVKRGELCVRQVLINPRTSAFKMTLQCKSRFGKSVNPETVRNVLRKQKYYDRVPQRKPYISKANRQTRLTSAKMYVKQQTE